MMVHTNSRLSLISLLVACAILAACNAPPPPQPLNLPVTLGFVDDDNGLRLVLATSYALEGGGEIAYHAAYVPAESGEAIKIELLGVRPCPTQYPPWPARGCPAAGMPATAEIALGDLPQVGIYPLVLMAGERTEQLELHIDTRTIHLRHAAESQIIRPSSEAHHVPEDGSHFWQRLQPLELPLIVGFLDDAHGLRMTIRAWPQSGRDNIAYRAEMPTAPGGEIHVHLQGLRLCMIDCFDAYFPVETEIALDDLPYGHYLLVVSSEDLQERLELDIGEYDIIVRPDTDNGVAIPNPDAAYVPNRYTRGDGLFHWRRLQTGTVWVMISYSGMIGGQNPTARDRAEFWEQVALVEEGLGAADDLEPLGMVEAFYAHPNFMPLWPRYAMPSHIQLMEAYIPLQVTYYRYTGSWDDLVQRVRSMLQSDIVSVYIYNFQGDNVYVARQAQAVPMTSPLSPPQ